jgi:GT2 family glycosyltransferase
MNISVVIPTCGRNDLLERCLQVVIKQNIFPSDYEVVVVDDSSDGAAWTVVRRHYMGRRHRQTPAVIYCRTDGREGPAVARNLGWRLARAPIIAFTDDDTIPARSWLREGLASFAGDVIALQGRVVVPLPPIPTDYEKNESGLGHAEFVTANCFVKREALRKLGGFDERFKLAWREDSDLHFRLLALARSRSQRLTRADRAVVVHPVRPGSWGISIKQQHKTMYNALLYKKHPALFRQHVQRTPPCHYYFIVAAAMLASAAGMMGLTVLAVISASVWAALTVSFMARRLKSTSHALPHVLDMAVTSTVIPFLSVFWRLYGAVHFRVLFL